MRGYRLVLILLWIAGCGAGYAYIRRGDYTLALALPVLGAMLVELSLYAGLAFQGIRMRWENLGRFLPWVLAASALAPYAGYSLPTGQFHWVSFATLSALVVLAAFWFVLLPRSRVTDAFFLALMAAVVLAKVFRGIYASPLEGLRIDVLGQLMWIRVGLTAVLAMRKPEGLGFGFWPSAAEWVVGVRHYACFLPLGVVLTYGLGFAQLSPAAGFWWKAPATFFGILWVVALSEELFFRGMLQAWLVEAMGRATGVLTASMIFGLVHLPFRDFPNWKFALLSALAGAFYGYAFLRGRGIRAAMVTHALVVTTWRSFFA